MLIPTLVLAIALITNTEGGLVFDSVKLTEKHDQLTINIALKNKSRAPIRVWDPLNYESRASIKILVRDERGKETDITPPPAPRGTGVATGTVLQPGTVLKLPPVQVKALRPIGATGKVHVIVLYRNDIPERDAVKGVWIGELRSALHHVRALNKS